MSHANARHEELRQFLALPEEEVLRAIGRDVAESEQYATPPGPTEQERLGTVWWKRTIKTLQASVCGSQSVHQVVCKPSDDFEIAKAIFDIVIGLKIGVSPVAATALVVKRGLGTVCGNEWIAKGPKGK